MSVLGLAWAVAGRERGAVRRLAGLASGVAVGVALLLLITAAHDALADRSARATWAVGGLPASSLGAAGPAPDQAVAAVARVNGMPGDHFEGRVITRIDVAVAPGSTIELPGIGAAPAPGHYRASPALAELIAAAPNDELEARFGVPDGIISQEGLVSPDSLLVVVGGEVERVAGMVEATVLSDLGGYRYPSSSYRIIAIVGGIAVLFPVVVLISIVTKLGQAARAERFATIRLIGATPRRIAALAALEAGAPALVGALLGVLLYLGIGPLAARVPVEGLRFFPSELRAHWGVVVLVALGTASLASLVAYLTALRSSLRPAIALGGSREQRERVPRWIALLPLALGLVTLTGPAIVLAVSGVQPLDLLPFRLQEGMIVGSFLLVAVGLLLAGPYLSRLVSGLGSRLARSAPGVLAMNRIAKHPRATFRSVSGLVIALFVVTVFAVASTTETSAKTLAEAPPSELVPADALMLTLDVVGNRSPGVAGGTGAAETLGQAEIAARLDPLMNIPGVDRVIMASWADTGDDEGFALAAADARALGIQAAGDGFVLVDQQYFGTVASGTPVRFTPLAPEVANGAEPSLAIVLTDGSEGALERARTAAIAGDIPLMFPPLTRVENTGQITFAGQYAALAWVGVILAMLVSAVSLSVSTIAGMIDRRRVLGLLRLDGMPASTLRRMLVIETALPLLTVFLLSIGLGFATAWALVFGLSSGRRTVSLPDVGYLGLLVICLALAAVAVIAVFRSVRSELPLSATRFE